MNKIHHKSFISESFSNSGSFESYDRKMKKRKKKVKIADVDSEEPDPLSSDSSSEISIKHRKNRPNKKRPWIGQLPPAKPLKRNKVLPTFLDFDGGNHSDEFDPTFLQEDAKNDIKPINLELLSG